MTELKPGWKRVKFGEVVRLNKETCKDPMAAGIERVIGLEHLEPGDLRVRSWADVADGTTFTNRVRSGQVLFGKRRAYQRKVAVANFDAICSGDIYVFETADHTLLLQELLPYICETDSFFEYAVGTSAGSLSPRTNWKSLASYEFALPPLEEQKRMQKLLDVGSDALMSLRQLEEIARQVHSSAIDQLASDALRSWPISSLDDFIQPDRPITYGILMPGKGFPGGVPVVKVRDFPAGEIATEDLLLTDPKIDHEYRRSRLRTGDLLLSIRGTIGRLAFVPECLNGANITQDTARLSIRPGIEPAYVRCLLESSWVRMQIRKNTTGLAVQGINIGELRRLRVPMPPESEQKKIAEAWGETSMAVKAAFDRSVAFRQRFSNLLNTVLSMS